jgi:hypothetical protein
LYEKREVSQTVTSGLSLMLLKLILRGGGAALSDVLLVFLIICILNFEDLKFLRLNQIFFNLSDNVS